MPITPVLWTAKASTPANGPSPTAVTNTRAKTTSGTSRWEDITEREAWQDQPPEAGVRELATASAKASGTDSVVPSRPMASVTRLACSPGPTARDQDRSGGSACWAKSTIPCQPRTRAVSETSVSCTVHPCTASRTAMISTGTGRTLARGGGAGTWDGMAVRGPWEVGLPGVAVMATLSFRGRPDRVSLAVTATAGTGAWSAV